MFFVFDKIAKPATINQNSNMDYLQNNPNLSALFASREKFMAEIDELERGGFNSDLTVKSLQDKLDLFSEIVFSLASSMYLTQSVLPRAVQWLCTKCEQAT